MAKRIAPPGAGKRKAPGVRRPRKKKALVPTGEHSAYPPYAERPDEGDGGLNMKQEKYVYEYIKCNGNQTEAYVRAIGGTREVAKVLAHRMMKIPEVITAIEAKREALRRDLNIDLQEVLGRLVAIFRTGPSDLLPVFRSPGRDESWRGLIGDKEFAVKKFSQGEFGNSLELHSQIEVAREIREILDLKKPNDSDSERDVTESVLAAAQRVLAGAKGKGST